MSEDMWSDFPEFTPGKITWPLLRRIIEWEIRHEINQVSWRTVEDYREEGYSASYTALNLGLLDYGQVSGQTD